MIIIDFRFSQEQSESGIHFLNTSSVLQLLKHSKSHYYCLTLDTGYSTVLYSVGSCAPTQRSWTITDFILHLHLHCRSMKFAPVSVWFPVSRLPLQLFCLPSLMVRSLHLIEVEGIIAKKKKSHLCKTPTCDRRMDRHMMTTNAALAW